MCNLMKYLPFQPILIWFQQVPVTGLKTMFRDGPLKHVAEDVLKLAKVKCVMCLLYHYPCN